MAGLLRHASEITAVTKPTRQLLQAPMGRRRGPFLYFLGPNQPLLTSACTHPQARQSQSARIEYRALDSAANPYLAFAVILAAGMKGIEEGYELPAEANNDVWALSEVERRALGIQALPTSLKSAVAQNGPTLM